MEITRHITREPTEGPQYIGIHQHSGIYNRHSEVGLWEATFQGHSVELKSVLDAVVAKALYCHLGHTGGVFEPDLPNCMEDSSCTIRVERWLLGIIYPRSIGLIHSIGIGCHVVAFGIINMRFSFTSRPFLDQAHALPGPSPPGINYLALLEAGQEHSKKKRTMQILFPFSKSLGSLI